MMGGEVRQRLEGVDQCDWVGCRMSCCSTECSLVDCGLRAGGGGIAGCLSDARLVDVVTV